MNLEKVKRTKQNKKPNKPLAIIWMMNAFPSIFTSNSKTAQMTNLIKIPQFLAQSVMIQDLDKWSREKHIPLLY